MKGRRMNNTVDISYSRTVHCTIFFKVNFVLFKGHFLSGSSGWLSYTIIKYSFYIPLYLEKVLSLSCKVFRHASCSFSSLTPKFTMSSSHFDFFVSSAFTCVTNETKS